MDVCYWFCYFRINWHGLGRHHRRRRYPLLLSLLASNIFPCINIRMAASKRWCATKTLLMIFTHTQIQFTYALPIHTRIVAFTQTHYVVCWIRRIVQEWNEQQLKRGAKKRKEEEKKISRRRWRNLRSFVRDLDDSVGCRHQESIRQLLFQCILYAKPVAHSYRDHLWRHRSTHTHKKERKKKRKRKLKSLNNEMNWDETK